MRRGLSSEAAEIMLSSIQTGIQKQYEKAIHLWWDFCQHKRLSPFEISTRRVTEFFTDPKVGKKSYSTLNIYRSAISLLSLNDLGKDPALLRFFKGLSVQKPQKPKYDSIWDPQPVLEFAGKLYLNQDISLEQLTKKLVILLALATAQRVQTLSKIFVDNIIHSDNQIQIKIPDRIKTSARNQKPLLNIPFFKDQPNLCVAQTLQVYIERTKSLRQETMQLFITHKKPYHAASSQTISRWIKNTLEASGIDTEIFSAHSTRHASTSAAARNGINIENIRKTAGWTENSRVFARFYNRPINTAENFTAAVIRSQKLSKS